MFAKSVRVLGLLSVAVALFIGPAQIASAKSNVVRMTTRVVGVKAVAKYEERGARRKFNFQLELGTPGQVGTVSAVAADGSVVQMGTFTVDALRRGIVDIDTTEGDVVADLKAGSVITLKINGNTYTGSLIVR